jgi:hypothetical protein
MPGLFATTFRVRAASGANSLVYTVQKIPLLGRLAPQRFYAAGRLKTAVTVIATVLRELWGMVTKALYLLVMALLPAQWLTTGDLDFVSFSGLLPQMAHILFWLSGVFILLAQSVAMNATREKYLCIRTMRADPLRYLRATLPVAMTSLLLRFAPGLLLCTFLAGGGLRDALGLWLMLAAFRLTGEAFQLWWFKRFGFSLFRKGKIVFPAMLLAPLVAWLPVGLGWPLPAAAVFLSPPGMAAMLAVLAASVWYVFRGYGNWGNALRHNLKLEYIIPNQAAAAQSAFRDVQMKEDDLKAAPRQTARLARKTGYAYFNALFFSRHRRQLFRPVLIRLVAVGVLLAAALLVLALFPELVVPLVRRLPQALPIFVFVMCITSMAAKATKAMFYNCDNSMLRYAFYRRPGVILQNFRIRLGYVAGYNLLVALTLCAAIAVLLGVAGAPDAPAMAAFFLSVPLLSVFFSVHNLFLYYVFQPYTSELSMKNPTYRFIDTLVYMASLACFQIKTAGLPFVLGVLGVTLLYIAAALVLVYRLAPKTFRVK